MSNITMDPVQNATNATAALVEATPTGLFVSSTVLFFLALGPIYFGSLRSKKYRDKEELEVVSSRDAAVFPLFASGALLGIYILFKFVPLQYINLLVNLHFSIFGTSAMASLICPMLRPLMPKFVKNDLYKFEFSKSVEDKEAKKKEDSNDSTIWKVVDHASIEIETRDFLGIAVAVAIGIWYFVTRHWIANNFVAYTLALLAIEYIRLNKFINGCLLLCGLFIYDIFWVFGTPVMVTVAKSLEAPIKVSFPRDFLVHGIFGKQMAILGLGDIVVPGIFIAMLLRFDVSLNRRGSQAYFITGYIAYVIGLITTFAVMFTFKAAQPALLYLVPACLGSTLLLAWIKGDLSVMFTYEDVPEHKAVTGSQTVPNATSSENTKPLTDSDLSERKRK